MEIIIDYEDKKHRLTFEKPPKISELIDKLNINQESVLIKIDNEIEPEDIIIKKENKIEIIKIISGG